MRLNRFRVKNFGCLRDVAVDFGGITVLVGPNDAGKSMILRGIATLTRALTAGNGWASVYPDEPSFRASTFNRIGGDQEYEIEGILGGIACSYETGANVGAYTRLAYETLDFKAGDGTSRRITRNLTSEHGDKTSVTVGTETREANVSGGGSIPLIGGHSGFSYPKGPVEGPWSTIAATIEVISRDLQALRPFRLVPNQLRLPFPVDASLPAPPQISPEGAGFPAAIANLLLTDRDKADRIETALKEALPGVRRLHAPPRDLRLPQGLLDEQDSGQVGRFFDIALETKQGATVSSRYISDGVLLYMAYLLLTMGPSSQTILMVEEPETGIHPGLLNRLIQLLRDFSEGRVTQAPVQVILTTHSPLVLNLLRPEEIRIVSKSADGTTQVTPFTNTPDLSRLLEFQGPGELWLNMGEDYIRRAKSAG